MSIQPEIRCRYCDALHINPQAMGAHRVGCANRSSGSGFEFVAEDGAKPNTCDGHVSPEWTCTRTGCGHSTEMHARDDGTRHAGTYCLVPDCDCSALIPTSKMVRRVR